MKRLNRFDRCWNRCWKIVGCPPQGRMFQQSTPRFAESLARERVFRDGADRGPAPSKIPEQSGKKTAYQYIVMIDVYDVVAMWGRRQRRLQARQTG